MNESLSIARPALLLCAAVVLAAPAALLAAGRVEGTVTNGTMGQPVADQLVQLLMPRGGMQEVASAKTDSRGRFSINESSLDTSGFYLLQVPYQGANYHNPVRFDSSGSAKADVTVYEATNAAPELRIKSAKVLLRAETGSQGDRMRVQELFALENTLRPPRAYVNRDGTFRFKLAVPSAEPTVAVAGKLNMPLPQQALPGKASGEFYIQYPIQPGLTVVMVAYDADYTARQFSLADTVQYPIGQIELDVIPTNLKVESQQFQPAGQDSETGGARLAAQDLKAGEPLTAKLSGAPVAAAPEGGGTGEGEVKTQPDSMTRLALPLAACFLLVLLWALGVRMAKEWPKRKQRGPASPAVKQLNAKLDKLLNSLADLDELFAEGKMQEKNYWKERLDLKARLVAMLRKSPPALLEPYATRNAPR